MTNINEIARNLANNLNAIFGTQEITSKPLTDLRALDMDLYTKALQSAGAEQYLDRMEIEEGSSSPSFYLKHEGEEVKVHHMVFMGMWMAT